MPDDWDTFAEQVGKDQPVDLAPPNTPASLARAATKPSEPIPLTDLGNARRLASRYGARLKYVDAWGPMYFTGTHWRRDDVGQWSGVAREVVRAIHLEAHAGLSDDRVKAILKWALSSQSRSRVESMIKLAESEPEIVTTPDIFDRDLMLLNCPNGTLDLNLNSGRLRPHNSRDHITRRVAADYNASAPCPIWKNFLDRIMRGNVQMIEYLQRAVGYSLTGLTIEQVLFLLWGTGANGKSVFLETLSTLLGDYAQTAEFSTFLTRNVDTVRNDLAPLAGARFVAASEAGEGRRLSEVLVKSMTGGDLIKARYLFKEYFSFRPQFKLWLAANHWPIIRGTDHAIWRRVMLIPFTVTIPPDERDKRLSEKLRSELSGILAWAVEGCLAWQRQGLGTPSEVTEANASYRSDMDALGAFVEECCIVAPSAEAGAGELYASYKAWAELNGEHFENVRAFRQRMVDRGFAQTRRGAGQVWLGVGLLTQKSGV
jgi:putative DNA primase/helicase